LDGIRVVEIAQWIAVPSAMAVLADWGAEVIKVEHPERGDGLRGYIPYHPIEPGQMNYIWELANRNKKSVTANLQSEEGRDIVYRLIKNSDVFVSNLRPYELNRYQLDYSSLANINPRLVWANLTGYGTEGPDCDLPGYDYCAFWARSGIMNTLPEPGMPPPTARPGLGDSLTSLNLAGAVMAALFHRERTGFGQRVEVSLFHTAVWGMGMDIQSVLSTGTEVSQVPRRMVTNPLWNYYQCKDGRWLMLVLLQPDPYWARFCQAIEREDLRDDPRFNSFESRTRNNEELIRILDTVFASKTLDEHAERLNTLGLPWARVQKVEEVINDVQAKANDFFVDFEHPSFGPVRLVNSPIKFSRTPASVRAPAPELGQHTEEVLTAIGYSWEEIAQFKEKGAI
jgi:crotonobetainyl-CoA:carnitine CoA-transferase CaiB-like acyl-CoA transferase